LLVLQGAADTEITLTRWPPFLHRRTPTSPFLGVNPARVRLAAPADFGMQPYKHVFDRRNRSDRSCGSLAFATALLAFAAGLPTTVPSRTFYRAGQHTSVGCLSTFLPLASPFPTPPQQAVRCLHSERSLMGLSKDRPFTDFRRRVYSRLRVATQSSNRMRHIRSRSAPVVSHHFSGFLLFDLASLFHPATGHGVHHVSGCRETAIPVVDSCPPKLSLHVQQWRAQWHTAMGPHHRRHLSATNVHCVPSLPALRSARQLPPLGGITRLL
jgi:hypothetical protein